MKQPEPTCWQEELDEQRAQSMYRRGLPLATPEQEQRWLDNCRTAVAHANRENEGDY